MTVENGYSLKDIFGDLKSAKFAEEVRGNWSTALLCRVPGFFLVWGFVRLGVGAMAVSLAALALAMVLPVLAYGLPLASAGIWVAVAGLVFQVLDCADGTLARVTGTTSRAGADVDFLTDMAQWGFLYLAIGILADRTLDTGWGWTAVACAAAWVRLMARATRDRLEDGDGGPPPVTPANAVPVFLAGISGLIPFLALSGPWLGVAVTALLVYALLDVLEGLLPLFRALRR
ncbi:MAG: CDP-alcohol phosphatidyltransferase family protein [Rhodobacter sp.]|nr:CDP-alcohol phosphatidyltransferase family protein [Rhodobacter sp.]